MDFCFLTLFPEMIEAYFASGMMRKALDQGLIRMMAMDIRDHANGKHRVTDDKLYGGGSGMVMKPEPLSAAILAAKKRLPESLVVYLTPQGRPFHQEMAQGLLEASGLIFVCGRYEGIDERVCDQYVDMEISVGDYVLTGGELPAMVISDAVARLIPGVLGGVDSAEKETFSEGLIEHAHYTRPAEFQGSCVPPVLLSGNHSEIDRWRLETSLIRTLLKRPDLLENRVFTDEEKRVFFRWKKDLQAIIDE